MEAYLAQIPNGVHLANATDEQIGAVSADSGSCDVLRKLERVGSVTASKLLARKQPHLVPVRDELDGGLREVLTSARSDAGLTETSSILRVLDVA